jgi:hypothetical protein
VNGGDGNAIPAGDLERAQKLASRFGCQFVDLHNFQLCTDLFKRVPRHLIFHYKFVPLEETPDGQVVIAVVDPSQLILIDEISLLLGKRIITKVTTLAQFSEILNKLDKTNQGNENSVRIAELPTDDSSGPSDPNAPVRAPLKPQPHPLSGAIALSQPDDTEEE